MSIVLGQLKLYRSTKYNYTIPAEPSCTKILCEFYPMCSSDV